MEISNQYIKAVTAENMLEVNKMKMMKTPGKLMLGIGLTAAAVAMTPVVRNMMNNKNSMSSDNNSSNYSLH